MGEKSELRALREIADVQSNTGRVGSVDTRPAASERVANGSTPVDPVANRPAKGEWKHSVDPELLGSFYEEAVEIMRAMDRNVLGWAAEPNNLLYRQNLLECLHTLKGGAQLCAMQELGELVHRLEGFLVEIQVSNTCVIARVLRELLVHLSRLAGMLNLAGRRADMCPAPNPEFKACANVPFSRLLSRLHAVVRLAADTLGKPVKFLGATAGVHLHAGVLRRLAMPLEHVLRNAVNHGIELPERRLACGKPVAGRINLHAALQGRDIVIEIEDDGGGIDAAKVRERALAGGFLARDACLRPAESVQFVFAPGVSTAQHVSRTCGRGIGSSAAQAGIRRLCGRMEVFSRPGLGTSFRIRIAREARIQRALFFQIRDDRYAIEDGAVDKVVAVTLQAMEEQKAGGNFEYRGVAWELRDLHELIGSGCGHSGNRKNAIVLLARCGARRVALLVDDVGERREVLVRRSKDGMSRGGVASLATLLDDGSMVVLLYPSALFGSNKSYRSSAV